MAPQRNLRAVAWMIGAAASFSLLVVCVRELSASLPTPEILFFRCLFTMAFLVPWALRAGRDAMRIRRPWPNLLRGVSTFAAMTMWFHAIGVVPLADAVAIQSAYPLFTILLAMLLFAERPGIRRWLATLAGFAGVLVIVRPGFVAVGLPTAMLLGAALCYAVSNICVKAMADTESPTLMVFTVNALLLAFSAVPTALMWVTPSLDALPWIALLAGSGFAAHMCLTRALATGEAGAVMPFDFLRLPFAALGGLMLYGEVPDLWTVAGGVLVFASAIYIAMREARPGR